MRPCGTTFVTGALIVALGAGGVVCDGRRPPSAHLPDIVLISVDTLRADRLGCYGAGRETSPAIDRLAAAGARFETVLAPTSWTLPSHVTLLTGLSIAAHRVARIEDRIDAQRRTLAQQLAAAGYRTAAFVSAPLLHRAYGFDRGFEAYRNFGVGEEPSALVPSRAAHLASHADRTAARVIGAALEWLAERPRADARPAFLFVHLWDPHYDYAPPAPYDALFDPDYAGTLDASDFERNREISPRMPARDLEHLRALYDGEIRWTDAQIARLVAALDERGSGERTIVSLVSDHGEEFFEHGRKGHMKALFEESVRVPWIVRYPARVRPGTVIPGVASLEDVAPTLLELAGVAPLAEATGTSRLAELEGRAAPERPALLELRDRVALRGDDWKVLRLPDGTSLYWDLAADPEERRPRPARAAAPEALAALESRLASDRRYAESLRWAGPERAPLDAATREWLRELGYVDDDPE